jgi:DNA (cytosine-5)-methyltransferase 1
MQCKNRGAYRDFQRIPVGRSLGWARGKAGGNSASGFSAVKYDPSKPAPTIPKNDGNIGMHGGMHWSEIRRFTVREYKRFASFPDDFVFKGEWKDAVARIGNAVPPLFMKAIAEEVKRTLESSVV